jgi:hypothetical protein
VNDVKVPLDPDEKYNEETVDLARELNKNVGIDWDKSNIPRITGEYLTSEVGTLNGPMDLASVRFDAELGFLVKIDEYGQEFLNKLDAEDFAEIATNIHSEVVEETAAKLGLSKDLLGNMLKNQPIRWHTDS